MKKASSNKAKKTDRVVLVRSGQSGVWIGVATAIDLRAGAVTLRGGLKIWRWRGPRTTSELALYGCDSEGFTRVAEPSNVTVLGVHEIHESNLKALERVSKAGWAK
jgi:hypothetical protein